MPKRTNDVEPEIHGEILPPRTAALQKFVVKQVHLPLAIMRAIRNLPVRPVGREGTAVSKFKLEGKTFMLAHYAKDEKDTAKVTNFANLLSQHGFIAKGHMRRYEPLLSSIGQAKEVAIGVHKRTGLQLEVIK